MKRAVFLNMAVLSVVAASVRAAIGRPSESHVPNEIVIKFSGTAAVSLEEQLKTDLSPGRLTLSPDLDELNREYKVKSIKPLFKDFNKNRKWLKALLRKDKTLLTKKEKRVLARLRRAPKDSPVPHLDRIYKLELQLEADKSLHEAVAAYNRSPDVEYAELNYILSIARAPNDPLYPVQWPLNNTGQMYPESGYHNHPPGTPDCDIDAPEAWDTNTGSSDVIIAVVDTGVDYNHPDLQGNMWVNEAELNGTAAFDDDGNGYVDDIYGYDFWGYDGDPKDDHGHGTHCAGIIAAETNNGLDIAGVCWNARIMALKFLDWTGHGATSAAVEAFYYAVENEADIASNSWGGGDPSQTLKEAIDYAHSQGVIMVASAGNAYTDTPVYPAAYDNMFSVAATDSNDRKADFSSYGDWVDVAAPGVDILSLRAEGTAMGTPYDANTTIASGTSMACPHVAGACALLFSTNPTLINVDVTDILMQTVDPVIPGVCRSGGRLNLFNAVLAAVPSKGRVHLDHDCYSCSSVISISLGDCDLQAAGTHPVALTTSGGDSETVLLAETAPPVGFFTGTISTAAGGPYPEDGTLQVTHGQIITVTYYDANDGSGSPATAQESAEADCAGPVILNVLIDPRGPEPDVTFETDEPSGARVMWGLACGATDRLATDSGLTTSHDIKLTPVSQATEYFFKIEVADALGNTTADDNDGACYSFVTDDGPGDIYVPGQAPTLQEAVDHSWDGGTVWVADGLYKGEGNRDIDFGGKAITVRSENGPANCIIDCYDPETYLPHRGFLFHSGEGPDSVLDGVTVINGYEYWFPPHDSGGAVKCVASSPTVRNCIFRDNVSGGGAMGSRAGSSPTVINCIFADNYGQGMANENSSPTVIDCTFSRNLATDIFSGAGMDNRYDSNPTVIGCTFAGNKIGAYGGGMANIESAPTVINCLFTANHAGRHYYPEDEGYGGGMYNLDSSPTVINCTFTGNSADDHGGGIAGSQPSRPKIANCILWANRDIDGQDEESAQIYGGTPNVEYCCIQEWSGILGGIGNIGDNPRFVKPGYWDDNDTPDNTNDDFWVAGLYYLLPGASPCIDAGDNWSVFPWVETDLEGWPRFLDDPNVPDTGNGRPPVVDMGAYEYWPPPNLYVDDDAPGDPGPRDPGLSDPSEDGTPAHPFDRIQEAIYAARTGKIVVVAPGTYYEAVNFIGKDIAVTGLDPNDPDIVAATIIDANAAGTAVTFATAEGRQAILTGFTITGGTGTEDWNGCWGGGVYCDHASPVIRANVITGNSCPAGSATEGKGGGIGCLNSRAVIERNIIRQNQADRGGGVFVYYYTWGSVYYGDVTVINNLIYDNFANDGGGVDIGGGLLVNNTIADNNAAARGGNVAAYRGAEPDGSRLVVANNIIAGALAGGGLAWMTDPNTLCDCIAYNNVWGNAGGDYNGLPSLTGFNGNISHDPQFVDKAARDYHLQCSSPCIEAGTNDPCGGLPATDFDQNLRPIDADKDGVAAADIGAFESLGNRPSILLTPMRFEFSATADDPNPPASALFIRNGACGTLNWELSETCPWLQVEPVTGSSTGEFNSVTVTVDTSALVAGSYNCDLTVSAPGAINSPQTVPVHLSFSGTLRVPTADYPTIRAAIDAAIDGDIILVADGTYTGPGNRDLDFKGKAIVVRGENGPQNCIIDCQGTLAEPHRGLYFHTGEGANSVVEGFTITGGCASSGGVIQNYTSSPTVRNCILIANSAYLGGAVNNYYSSPTFENCLFAENTADWGGAIENMNSSPTITNSAFTKNTASYGGAIDNYGGSTPKVTGCILWGNDADNGPQIYGDASVSYSDVQAGCPGEGNIDADPLFVDAASGDFHLSPGSPAIDAGHPLTDWSNEPWPNGGRVNMGAYGNTKEATRSSAGFEDLAQLCAYWLQYDPLLDIAPEPAGDGIINFLDFAIFADWWLTE